MNEAAVRAYGEAESLFALFGVTASDLYYEAAVPRLPSIRSWFSDSEDIDALFVGDHESGNDANGDFNDLDLTHDYQFALDVLEGADDDLSFAQERRLMDYRYASIALSIEEHAQM